MDAQENKDGGKSCCAKGNCCGGKALAALALLLVGAAAGYFIGRHCAACPLQMGAAAPAVSAPAPTPAK